MFPTFAFPLSSPLPIILPSPSAALFTTGQFTPTVGSLVASSTYLAGQTFSSTLVDFVGVASAQYALGGVPLTSTSVSFAFSPPANVSGILKTATVYYSTENAASSVSVLYSVTDSVGRTTCSPSGASVTLTVGAQKQTCVLFSAAAPYGLCNLIVSPSSFGATSSNLSVILTLNVSGVVVATATLPSVTLAAIPSQPTPTYGTAAVGSGSGSIYFQVPPYTTVPGDRVTVSLWIQSGSVIVSSLSASIVYNATLLTFYGTGSSYPPSSTYYGTIGTGNNTANAINITAGSITSGTPSGFFKAVTLTFTIKSNAAGSTLVFSSDTLPGNQLVNTIGNTFLSNTRATFADLRGGWNFSTGQVQVAAPSIVGLYTFSGNSTFVNTFVLNGVQASDTLTVKATFDTGRLYAAYADVTVNPSCSAGSSSLSISNFSGGCNVTLAQVGGGTTVVSASYQNATTSAAYRAYYFLAYSLNTTRALLRKLGCGYETAWLSAYGTATLDGTVAVALIDVSRFVTFVSSNASILNVSGQVAYGVLGGPSNVVTVSYGNGSASILMGASNVIANVTQLISYVFTSAAVSPTALTSTELSSTLVTVTPALSLTAELQNASVVTYAKSDDNIWTDVSMYSTLTLASLRNADLTVFKSGGVWKVQVPIGASTITGSTHTITGTLNDTCGAVLISSSAGYVYTNLSSPVNITLTASVAKLARPGSNAQTALGLPSSAQISVTMYFNSTVGIISSKNFTLDPRTVYNVSVASNAVASISASGGLSLTTSTGSGSAGSVTVTVTTPSYASAMGLVGTLTLSVVDVNASVALQGALVHYVCSSCVNTVAVSSVNPLSLIACSGVYQSGSLSLVTVTLTDQTTLSGTPSLASSAPTVATISGTMVNAMSAGTATLTASYAGATSSSTVYVSSAAVNITALTLSYVSPTLSGQVGVGAGATVAMSFSDGTAYSNATSQFTAFSSLVNFTSNDTAYVSVNSSSGLISLADNSWRYASITANSKCSDGRSSSFAVAGNLVPVVGDTKLGSSTGLTFPPASIGSTVTVNVKVQVSASIKTYGLWIFYDRTVFGSYTFTVGSGWTTGSRSNSSGNFVAGNMDKIILSYSNGGTGTGLVIMGVVTLQVLTSSPTVSLITGNVTTIETTASSVSSATGTQVRAGTAYVSINGGATIAAPGGTDALGV